MTDSLIVIAGARVEVSGHVQRDLVVYADGHAVIVAGGVVRGDVFNFGGRVEVFGGVQGRLYGAGRTTVHDRR